MKAIAEQILCRIEDIPEGEGKGFDIDQPEEIIEIVLVRRGDAVFGYRNDCPHVGTPLNWVDDRFMTLDRKYILCATHGAEFRVEDGYCIAGPCAGDSLTPIDLELRDGTVVLRGL